MRNLFYEQLEKESESLKISKVQLEQVKMDVCDKLCRFPFQLDQEELEDKCEACPLNRLGE